MSILDLGADTKEILPHLMKIIFHSFVPYILTRKYRVLNVYLFHQLQSMFGCRAAIAWATWDLIARVESGIHDGPATHAVTFVWNGHEVFNYFCT